MHTTAVNQSLDWIRGDYQEMPGLTLTVRQAARLWALPAADAEHALTRLVDDGFLLKDGCGGYRRRGCPRCC